MEEGVQQNEYSVEHLNSQDLLVASHYTNELESEEEDDEVEEENSPSVSNQREEQETIKEATQLLEKKFNSLREIAIKLYRKKDMKISTLQRLKKDIEILVECRGHPNVVTLYGLSQDKYFLYFILELCPNGSLADKIRNEGKLSITLARFYAAEIVNLLEFIHSKRITHRKITADKFLLDASNHLKISSFSCAVWKDHPILPEDTTEANEFYAPEVIKESITSRSSDIYAFGVILCMMLTGRHPFGEDRSKIPSRMLARDYDLDGLDDHTAIDLINQLLTVDPEFRLGSGHNGYQKLKSHPFFEGIFSQAIQDMIPPKEPRPLSHLCLNFIRKHNRQYWKLDFPWEKHLPTELLTKIFHSLDNLEEMRNGKKYLLPHETVLRTGYIWKKTMILRRKYQLKLVLTDLPRFVLLDPKKRTLKEEIRWSPAECTAKAVSPTSFLLRTQKSMISFDLTMEDAGKWAELIAEIKRHYL